MRSCSPAAPAPMPQETSSWRPRPTIASAISSPPRPTSLSRHLRRRVGPRSRWGSGRRPRTVCAAPRFGARDRRPGRCRIPIGPMPLPPGSVLGSGGDPGGLPGADRSPGEPPSGGDHPDWHLPGGGREAGRRRDHPPRSREGLRQPRPQRRIDDYYPAQAQFFLGRFYRTYFSQAVLDPNKPGGTEQLAKDLEYKAELLLSAQGHYLRAIRMGNTTWATGRAPG